MKEIYYTPHLKLRLKVRNFPENYPLLIYKNPEMRFYDCVEKNEIAIKRLKYKRIIRNIMIAYEEKGNKIELVTIHPISDEKIINRTLSGRWTKNER
ncbi:MAG: DUF4258 domain-containing protein [Candidatus Pacearchaeota archaeon]